MTAFFCCFFVFMQSGESTVDLQYLELARDRKKSSTYQEFDLSRVWKKKHSKNELRAIFLWFNDTRFYIWLIYDKVTILNSFLKCFFASFTAFWLLWKRFHILILGYACPDYAWSCRVQLLEWSYLRPLILLLLANLVVYHFLLQRRYHFHHHLHLTQVMKGFLCHWLDAPQ